MSDKNNLKIQDFLDTLSEFYHMDYSSVDVNEPFVLAKINLFDVSINYIVDLKERKLEIKVEDDQLFIIKYLPDAFINHFFRPLTNSPNDLFKIYKINMHKLADLFEKHHQDALHSAKDLISQPRISNIREYHVDRIDDDDEDEKDKMLTGINSTDSLSDKIKEIERTSRSYLNRFF